MVRLLERRCLKLNERIALLRKDKGMTRASFGEQIGVSGDVINNLERGRVEIKDHMILLICKAFDVNETWLRTGEGDMYLPLSRETEIAKLTVDLFMEEPESFKNRFISMLARMSDTEWELLEAMVNKLSKKE